MRLYEVGVGDIGLTQCNNSLWVVYGISQKSGDFIDWFGEYLGLETKIVGELRQFLEYCLCYGFVVTVTDQFHQSNSNQSFWCPNK